MKEKIYFIPGLMTDIRLWKRVLPLLKDYEIVHIPIPHSTDFDKINETLLEVFSLNERDDEKINILGFSLGGYIASYFSIKFPQKVKRLFMVASTPAPTSHEEIARRQLKLDAFKSSNEFGLSYEKALYLVEPQNKEDKDLVQTIVDMFMDLGKETFISQLTSSFHRVDLFEDLIKLKIPIFMFYSTEDRLLDKNSLEKLQNEKHNIKLFSRVGTSHNIPLEVPDKLAKNIKLWMKA